MKKIFTKMMLWAVAATALVSCENNFNDTTVNGDTNLVKVTLTADKPTVVSENRTELDNEGQPLWSVGDKIGVYTAQEKDATIYPFTNDNETDATATTTFTGNTALANTLYVYYPCGDKILDGGARGTISATQQPTATSFDGASDIMIAKPVTLDPEGNQLSNLEFARLGAIVKVVLKDKTGNLANQHLSTLTMTAATNLAGYVYLDVVNQELGNLYSNQSQSVTANYTPATTYEIDGTNATYIVVYPQTLASGSKLTFNAQTEGYTITKEITLSQDINLAMGKVTTLNVSLDATNVEEIETIEWVNNAYNLVPNITGLAVGDKVVIAAAGYDMALSTTQNTNNRSAVAITKNTDNNTIKIDSTVEVLTLVEGSVEGTFAFKTSDNKYLYAASSSSNHLKSQESIDGNASFLITITDGIATVTAQGSNTRNIMRYNTSSLFSCYSSGQQDICIYKLVGEYTMPPVLIVNVVSITDLSYEGDTATFTYSVANPVEDTSVVITDDADWLTTTDNNGTVTVTVEENTLEEVRNATITVTYGDQTKTIAIQQNAKPGEGGEQTAQYVKVTSTSDITSGTYLIVYESKSYAFNGGLATASIDAAGNYKSVTISNNTIESNATTDALAFVYDATNKSFKGVGGAYIGRTATSNGMDESSTTVRTHSSVTISNGNAIITSSGGPNLQFYDSGSNSRFRYFATTQKAIQLYKLVGGSSEGGDTPETPAPVLAVTSATTIEVAAAGDVPTITYTITNPVDGQSVTASADQTWVNEFDYTVAGEVSFLVDANTGAARTATVTLAYQGAESQTVTISQAAGNTGGGDEPATKVWTLVTDASTLKAGDQIVIASNTKGFTAGAISSSVMATVTSTFASDQNTITSLGSGTEILTLGGSADAWTLTNESGKLLGATAAKKVDWDSGTTTWSITISDNNATIQNGTASYGRFLYNVNSPRFTTYTSNASSSMLLPQIYRLQ